MKTGLSIFDYFNSEVWEGAAPGTRPRLAGRPADPVAALLAPLLPAVRPASRGR